MNFYEHHLGDYLKDAGHLSMLEHGAYRCLLDAYYIREAPLPADRRSVYKLARATTAAERKAVDYVLGEFFTETSEGYRQQRADNEISRYAERAARSRENGKAGGRPRKTQRVFSGIPETNQTASQIEPSPVPSPQSPEVLDSPSQDTHSVPLSSVSLSARVLEVDPDTLRGIQDGYPAGTYRQSEWLLAEREIRSRIAEGESVANMLAGVERYAAQCEAKGSVGSQYVLSPGRFFRERQYREPFPLPAPRETATDRILNALPQRTWEPPDDEDSK